MNKFLLALIVVCLTSLLCPPTHAQPAQWPGVGKTADFITGKHGG